MNFPDLAGAVRMLDGDAGAHPVQVACLPPQADPDHLTARGTAFSAIDEAAHRPVVAAHQEVRPGVAIEIGHAGSLGVFPDDQSA